MNIVNEVLVYCQSKGYKIQVYEVDKSGPEDVMINVRYSNYDLHWPDWWGHEKLILTHGKLLYKGPAILDRYDRESPKVPSFDLGFDGGSQINSDHFWISAFDDNQQKVITWRVCLAGLDGEGWPYWSFMEVNGVRLEYGELSKEEPVDDGVQAWLDERATVAPYLQQIHEQIRKFDSY